MQKKNTNNEKNEVEFISAEFGAGLPAPASGYISGNIPCGPHLALGSLFKATSDPQSLAVSFRLCCVWDGPLCSELLAFYQHRAQGWVIQCLKAPQVPPPPVSICSSAISLSLATDLSVPERTSSAIGRMRPLDHPLGGTVQLSGKMQGMFPCPLPLCHTLSLSSIISRNVQFLMSYLSISMKVQCV